MNLIIHSYGYSEVIYHTLQALAMFRNSEFYPTIVTTMTLMVGVFYALKIAGSGQNGNWGQYLVKIGGIIIFVNTLILPKTSMLIKDHVEKSIYKVDNIPVAFALPIGFLENFGHVLTMGFEQTFARIGSPSAHKYYTQGMVFGARLHKELLNAKIRDPETAYNMRNFIDRCVINTALKGEKYTLDQLLASNNMWKLVKDNAGNLLRVDMVINGKREMPNCRESVHYFGRKFDQEIHSLVQHLIYKFRGAGGKQKEYNVGARQLNETLKQNMTALYNSDSSVDAVIKHNMMINSMDKNISGKYPSVKALMQAEAGGLLSADMADKSLVASLAVMKVIIYSAYIFLLPLMILSGGISKYKMWILAAFSLTLWPPLFSVLNMIIDFAYEPLKIVSYSTWSTEYQKVDSIASIAGNLTLMIPFLAFWMTKIGEGGFVHLASAVMANATSAVGSMAGERASGRREWDNESIGNSTREVINRNKHDDNMQYVTGNQSWNRRNGTSETITAGGKVVSIGGAGHNSSVGEAGYSELAGVSSAIHKSYRDEQQALASDHASYTEEQNSLVTKEVSALYQIAKNRHTGNGYDIDTSIEEGQAINEFLNNLDKVSINDEYAWKQNAATQLKINFTIGGILAKVIGIDCGFGASAGASKDNSQSDSNIQDVADSTDASSHTNNNERVSNKQSYLSSLGVDKSTQDSMRESYAKMQRLDRSIAVHQDNIQAYNESLEYVSNHGAEYRRDMTQDVIDAYSTKYGVSASDAYQAVSKGTADAQEVFKEISQQKAEAVYKQIQDKRTNIVTASTVDSFTKLYKNKLNENSGNSKEMQTFKDGHNMNELGNAEGQVANTSKKLKDEFNNKSQLNDNKYQDKVQKLRDKHQREKNKINEYEKRRVGTGLMSHMIVKGGIGRPSNANGWDDIFNPKNKR